MAHRIDTVVLDKTGTVTRGQAAGHARLRPRTGFSEAELLRLAARAERYSEHPLGKAVVEAAQRARHSRWRTSRAFRALAGHGVRARVEGREVRGRAARRRRSRWMARRPAKSRSPTPSSRKPRRRSGACATWVSRSG